MSMPGVAALAPAQVAAATRIHDQYMPQWAASDAALEQWRGRVPGWDVVAALAKAAVINDLYAARHDRLVAAAEQIAQVMQNPPADPVALVDAIAPLQRDGAVWAYVSFASKFVHWFVAPEAAPIYDAWALEGLRHHFGRFRWAGRSTYRAYTEYVQALQAACPTPPSLREMDRYLWLSGMYRAWLRAEDRRTVALSGEVRSLFDSDSREVWEALQTLVGAEP